jgi:hypothetical protein
LDDFFIFVCIALVIIAVAAIVLAWIKYRAPKPVGESRREVELLTSENAGLKSHVGRLEERIAVLERIATDPAERTAREIEQLRHA